jgi:hypothetical protein
VIECIAPQVSWKQKLKYGFVKKACDACPLLTKLIKTELQEPDIDRGIIPGARYIAFKKEAHDSEDTRLWHFYRDF